MKKLLFLFLTVSLLACSGDDSSDSVNSNDFNPPAWIQGTWGYENVNSLTPAFRFKPADVCQLLNNGMSESCWGSQVELLAQNNVNYTVDEQSTDSSYSVAFGSNGTTNTLTFEKISDSKIKWINGSTNPELVKL